MLKYLAARMLYTLPVAFGVSVVCFMLVHIAPGDPLTSILPPDASAQLQQEMRALYGFDRPLPVQYGIWLLKVLQGDFGTSIATGRPVATELGRALGNTFILAVVATLIGFLLGSLFGFVAGLFP
jgi:peptide/nickel transport system permease protein